MPLIYVPNNNHSGIFAVVVMPIAYKASGEPTICAESRDEDNVGRQVKKAIFGNVHQLVFAFNYCNNNDATLIEFVG